MNRRKFTGLTLGALALSGFAGAKFFTAKIKKNIDSTALINGTWKNWSGGQVCSPKEFFVPKTEQELINKLKNTTNKVRVVGGGHSFSPLVPTDAILSNLENLKGIININRADKTAVIAAGSPLYELTEELFQEGLAFPNQGDIDRQSLAGAVSTSTHGTGKNLQSFAGCVLGFKLITANGEVLKCSPLENPDIFYGGLVSFGTLGIVTEYEVQLEPAYKLKENVYLANTEEVLNDFERLASENRNFELMPFVASDYTLVKTLNKTEEASTEQKEPFLNDDILLSTALQLSGNDFDSISKVQNAMKGFIEPTERVGQSHKIYPSVRNVLFNEMEYEIPYENGIACLREIRQMVKDQKLPVFFPLEVRTIKSDEFWMSPFYRRDTIAISVHKDADDTYDSYFKKAEEIFIKYKGRPHWGKLSYLDQEGIKAQYPKFDDFVALKKRLDPAGRFSNPYMIKLFGL